MDNLNKLQEQQQVYKPKIDVAEFTKNFRQSYPIAKQAIEDFRHQQAEAVVFGRMLPR